MYAKNACFLDISNLPLQFCYFQFLHKRIFYLLFIYVIYTWSAYFSVKNISIPREKETALLLQKTAQQLGTSKIDIEALTRTFQFYDNERTEMLSANEVLVIGLFIILLPLFFLSVFYNISWRFLSMNLDFRLQYFFLEEKVQMGLDVFTPVKTKE